MIIQLVLRGLKRDRSRTFSAVLGVAAAVGLLTWHLGLTFTAISQGQEASERAAAPFQAWIAGPARARGGSPSSVSPVRYKGKDRAKAVPRGRGSSVAAPLPAALLQELSTSPSVSGTCPLAVYPIRLDLRPGGRVMQGPPIMANTAILPQGGIPFDLSLSEGRLPLPGTLEAVVCENVFQGRRLTRPSMNTPLPMILQEGTLTLKIVGLFPASRLAKDFPRIYTTSRAMEKIIALSPGYSLQPNLVLLKTKKGVDPAEIGCVMDRIPEADPCVLSTCTTVASRFRSETVGNLLRSLPLSLSLAMITAACMLGTVLVIGLALRRKRIAELRCAGMTRAGVSGLILTETVFLLLPGWLIGLLAGCGVLQIFLFCEAAGKELPKWIHPGWQTPCYTLALALLVGGLGVIVPLIQSLRVKPMEVVGKDISRMRPVSLKKSLLGVLLLFPMPLFAHTLRLAPEILAVCMLAIGIPCFIVGMLLCIHPMIRLVEICLLKPIGGLLGLAPRLLSRRISRDPGRALGTLLTLSLGLGGFMAVHIWGGTLMSSYVPSPEWPDVIVSTLPLGLSHDQAKAASVVKGIEGAAIPIETSQFPMDRETEEGIRSRGLPVPEGVILIFGADPVKTFGGKKPLADFRFVEGSREDAARQLSEKDACVIPTMLSRRTGLHLGDTIGLADKKLLIAGVVELNWHLVTSRARVRNLFGRLDQKKEGQKRGKPRSKRTEGMVFLSEKLARDMTGNRERVNFLWFNLNEEYRALHPLQATVRLDESIRSAVKDDGHAAIQVHHRDEVADGTIAHGNDILGTMARIPFWSLIVTSTGIIALLISSAQSSKEEIGTLRAIGMTEGQLARLFFGEALLITASSLLLSFIGGGLYGWSFSGWTQYSMRAGLPFTIQIPWGKIAQGTLFALALCILMSILPLKGILRSFRFGTRR